MHKERLKDAVKVLFGDGNEREFLYYFTSRFPRLLVHCYNVVEKEASDLLTEYFHQIVMDKLGIESEGSELTKNCQEVITFPQMKTTLLDTLIIRNSSRLFIEDNKSLTDFLQWNGSNVTKLELFSGTLMLESLDKILQKLPNLKEIQFDGVEYENSKAVLTAT